MIKNLKYCLLIIVCCLFHSWADSQIKSSKKFIDNTEEQKIIRSKIDSAKQIFKSNPVGAFECVETAISLAVSSENRYELAEAYLTLSGFNISMAEYNSAILHANRALEIYTSFEDWEKVYEAYFLIGDSYFRIDDYDQSYNNFESAALLAEKGKRIEAELKARFELGNIRMTEGNFTEAEDIYIDIRAVADKKKMLTLVAEIDYKLGEIYDNKGEISKAQGFYGVSQSNALETDNASLLNRNNQRFVESYSDGDLGVDDQTVYNSLDEAGTYFVDTKDTVSIVENSFQKADLYVAQGNLDDAVEELNYSYTLSEEYGDLDAQINSTMKLYDVYKQSENAAGATLAYQNYTKLLDSVANIKEQEKGATNKNQIALRTVEKQIDNLERERELDQQTIELLEKEKELNNEALGQQRRLLYVFSFILVIFLAVSVIVYRNTKAKKRAHQLLYLKSLRAQMNPHFIFNSLNSVNNYISKSNERAANKYLSKFSKLMRQVLEYSQVEFISLAKEIEVLQLYVELEHERFKDKFDFNFTVDDSINMDVYSIPPMLVQPFIENAIWHGLRYKDTGGVLEVGIKDKTDFVEISVSDNGIGRIKSQELKTANQKKHNSTGMRNVENRTALVQAVFKTKISYEIIDLAENGGTQVIIKLYRNE